MEMIVIGGGAAGFFGAIAFAEKNPGKEVWLLEKHKQVLAKVRISGGGRCNVTHHCFDPELLIKNYPRGSKELLGPYHRFQPKDTISWFAKRGVELKVEEDGRMFPVTDSSETIIGCLMEAADRACVQLKREVAIHSIQKVEEEFFLDTNLGLLKTKKLLLTTGSAPAGHEFAKQFGHTITPLAPSLFSFNLPGSQYLDLSGLTLQDVEVSVPGTKLKERGPLLFTHWGFSGPSILRLSAWGARYFQEAKYQGILRVCWAPDVAVQEKIAQYRKESPAKFFNFQDLVEIPKSLSDRFHEITGIKGTPYAQLKKSQVEQVETLLMHSEFQIEGKTTNKQEFVTCGGVSLKEVNFSTMESKLCKGLYFAGEILDIDGITGGFNFQSAWTTSWIAGSAF